MFKIINPPISSVIAKQKGLFQRMVYSIRYPTSLIINKNPCLNYCHPKKQGIDLIIRFYVPYDKNYSVFHHTLRTFLSWIEY